MPTTLRSYVCHGHRPAKRDVHWIRRQNVQRELPPHRLHLVSQRRREDAHFGRRTTVVRRFRWCCSAGVDRVDIEFERQQPGDGHWRRGWDGAGKGAARRKATLSIGCESVTLAVVCRKGRRCEQRDGKGHRGCGILRAMTLFHRVGGIGARIVVGCPGLSRRIGNHFMRLQLYRNLRCRVCAYI
jgi:hypothetical protein